MPIPTKPAVNTEHPEYTKNKEKWNKVRKVINSDVREFIRTIDPNDKARSESYRDFAQLTNFTLKTRIGLVGLVFRKEPRIDGLPEEMKYLLDNADGNGLSLKQMMQRSCGNMLEVGREALVAEFPETTGVSNLADAEALGIRATLASYSAESLINWRTAKFGTQTLQTLAVVKECTLEAAEGDEFQQVEVERYRVFRLRDGYYTQQVYDAKLNPISGEVYILDGYGQGWERIPMHIIGATNNDLAVDNSPLYDLACLNIGHLNNSADVEENSFFHGQQNIFLNLGDMDAATFKEVNGDSVQVGARGVTILGAGSSVMTSQAGPNQLADTLQKRKEEQAIMIGAKLITPSTGIETAEAVRMRNSTENASLLTIVQNVSSAYTKALQDLARFMGIDGSNIKVSLNERFYEAGIDPNEIAADIAMLDKGIIAMKDLRDRLRSADIIDTERTDEEIDAEADPMPEPAPQAPQPDLNPTDNRL